MASNTNGYDILVKTDYIEVQPSYNLPVANFSANTTVVEVGGIVNFQDESSNVPTSWIWQFEGGFPETSSEQNPEVLYSTPGIYNVKLFAFNANGNNTLIKTDYIEVQSINNIPIANFSADNTTVGMGETVNFQDESLNTPTSWIWQFEGGYPEYFSRREPYYYNTIPLEYTM